MTTVILIRHGRSTANAEGVLAGRAPGVDLDESGREQAASLRAELEGIEHAYSSPVARCLQTAALAGFPSPGIEEGLSECDYGDWTGRTLKELASEPLWETVQRQPSAAAFPGGESMLEMGARTVAAVRIIVERHPDQPVAVFSHGDPIKAILADALAVEFDEFQRIDVSPGSVSVIDVSGPKPLVRLVGGRHARGLFAASGGPTVGGSVG